MKKQGITTYHYRTLLPPKIARDVILTSLVMAFLAAATDSAVAPSQSNAAAGVLSPALLGGGEFCCLIN